MTVSSTTTKNSYNGNGILTAFAYGFKIFDEDDIAVILRDDATGTESTQSITTHYSVSGVGSASGGNITFGTAPATGKTVVLLRTTPLTQATDYTPNDPFPADAHEDALDKLTFIAQELQEELGRSIKISQTNSIATAEFTQDATSRANKVRGFDGDGDLVATQDLGVFRGTDATITTADYDARDLVKSTTTAQLNNVYIALKASTTGVLLTNTTYWALIVDAVSAATSATNAAASEAAAGTSETNAGNSETAAATSATKSENYAVKVDGAVPSTGDHSAKAWAVGGTGVTDTAGAGPAKDWATETTGQVDGTEYSAKEYAIGSQAGNTSGSAKQWALGGGGSYASNTTVDGSNYSARYWAEQAAASVDGFDDTYLGPKSSDPTLDNDGDALTAGDLYFNTSDNALKVYDGTAWNNAAADTTSFATKGFSIAVAIAL